MISGGKTWAGSLLTYHIKVNKGYLTYLLLTVQHPSQNTSDCDQTEQREQRWQEVVMMTGSRTGPCEACDPETHLWIPLSALRYLLWLWGTCVSASLLTVWITAILFTLFVLVEWEFSCKDEILFTFVIEWLWRERKHGANRYICHGHADKTTACRKWDIKKFWK